LKIIFEEVGSWSIANNALTPRNFFHGKEKTENRQAIQKPGKLAVLFLTMIGGSGKESRRQEKAKESCPLQIFILLNTLDVEVEKVVMDDPRIEKYG